MIESARVYRRKRPAMGTFATITVERSRRAPRAVAAAFAELRRLEAMLTVFAPGSALSRLNDAPVATEVEIPPELAAVLRLALRVRRLSGGAFDPWFASGAPPSADPLVLIRKGGRTRARKLLPVRLDLSGVAKGFAVDRAVAALKRRLPRASGCVDVGGDLRFFGSAPRLTALRVGPPRRPFLRRLRLDVPALACSSPAYARAHPASSTRYGRRARAATAAAVARSCMRADALTKVGLFADPRTARACAQALGASILLFDGAGRARA